VWSAWLPVVAYAAVIFTLSSMPVLGPPIKASNIDKLAHFLEYGGLGILLARAFMKTSPGRSLWFYLGLALVIGAATAAVDEVYQGTRGREQSLGDWIADAIGLLVVSGVYLRVMSRRGLVSAAGKKSIEQRSANP
jgi:VanZ family protein